MTDVVEALIDSLGEDCVLTGEAVSDRASGIWRSDPIRAKAIVRPRNTEQVSQALAICHAHDQSVVAHGGLTGLVESAIASPDDVALSLERLNQIEEINAVDRTMVVQSGVILQTLQEPAEEHGLMFPLDLGGRAHERTDLLHDRSRHKRDIHLSVDARTANDCGMPAPRVERGPQQRDALRVVPLDPQILDLDDA